MYAEMMGLLVEDKGGLSINDAFMLQIPMVGRVYYLPETKLPWGREESRPSTKLP